VGVETIAADWTIMVPSNPGTVRFPEMPVDLVSGYERPSRLSYVEIVEASWLPDYETARNAMGSSRATTGSMRTSSAAYLPLLAARQRVDRGTESR
jgi:hypothetical protein